MTFTYLQIFLAISFPIMGLTYALVGGLKLPLVERLQIDEAKVGRIVGGFGTMFGPTILICGFLTDALGRKGIWLAGSAAVALALFVFAGTRTFRGALIGVLLLGTGWAAQVNVGNVLQRLSAPPEKLLWATNFFDFVFGFGAFLTPMVLALVLRKLGYSRGLTFLAVVAIIPLVLGVFVEMHPDAAPVPAKESAAQPESGLGKLLSDPLFWIIGFAFLFYVPLETSVGGWATTLVTKVTPREVPEEDSKRVAAIALSGFWLGFTGSRLLVALLGAAGLFDRLGKKKEQVILLSMALACVALTLTLAYLRSRWGMVVAVILVGLACGPVFPTMITMVFTSVPSDTVGRAVGIFFFFASVGWTVIPPIIGTVAKRTDNIQKGFLVAAASCAVFLGFIIARGMMGT
jgi:fucose permease